MLAAVKSCVTPLMGFMLTHRFTVSFLVKRTPLDKEESNCLFCQADINDPGGGEAHINPAGRVYHKGDGTESPGHSPRISDISVTHIYVFCGQQVPEESFE